MGVIFSTRGGSEKLKVEDSGDKKTVFTTKQSPDVIGPYSKAARAGNMLFCSGQIGLNPKTMELIVGGVEEETKQACHNIEAILSEFGLGFKNVVKTTLFVKNIADFEIVDTVYKNYFVVKPARTMVEVSALPKGAQIEIEVIAEFK